MKTRWHPLVVAALTFFCVVGILVYFPEISDTMRRFRSLPPAPTIEPGQVETAEKWAQEVLRTGHNLVAYIWVMGAIGVGLLAAVTVSFFIWWGEHKQILHSLGSWKKTVQLSEDLVLNAAQMLPGEVSQDFSNSSVLEQFNRSVENMLPTITPEEIDIQIANTALVTPIPLDMYIRLGNYFRFRAHRLGMAGNDEGFKRDLWYAIRRYRRAREHTTTQSEIESHRMYGHASQGIALCLLRLGRSNEAVAYAREAVDFLRGQIGAVVLPLITYGSALKRAGRLDEAIKVLEEAEHIEFHPLGIYNLACFYARKGDEQTDGGRQIELYNRAISKLEELKGRLGSHEYVIDGVDTDTDFDGMRGNTDVVGRFRVTLVALKAEH